MLVRRKNLDSAVAVRHNSDDNDVRPKYRLLLVVRYTLHGNVWRTSRNFRYRTDSTDTVSASVRKTQRYSTADLKCTPASCKRHLKTRFK